MSDMNNDTNQTDFERVKGDVVRLVADVSSWIATTSARTREKWEETKPILEEKLAHAEAEANRYASASAGAAGEMGKGFANAFTELKKAYADARTHFEYPETKKEADDDALDDKEEFE